MESKYFRTGFLTAFLGVVVVLFALFLLVFSDEFSERGSVLWATLIVLILLLSIIAISLFVNRKKENISK